MSKLRYILVFTLILGLTLISQTGCLLVAVGAVAGGTAAGVAYATGDLEATVDAPPTTVTAATEKAFKELDVTMISKESGHLESQVTGYTSGHVKMTVVIKGASEQSSWVSIRMGTFGDDAIQARVLEKIRENVGTSPASQPTVIAGSKPSPHVLTSGG